MFHKLQRRFMWVSTLVLFLVISVVAGTVYWITSGTIMSQTQVLMELILDNDGKLPSEGEFNANQQMFLALNAESIHEIRYFSARAADGAVELTEKHINLSDDEAQSLAERVYAKGRDRGRLNLRFSRILHYEKCVQDDGDTLMVLLDSTSRYSLIRLIVMYMAALWFTVLVLYVIIMGRYSKKLIKPFVENDERQKRFITNASHELKTPLAVISANTEMTEVLGGKSKWTESTRRQVARLQSLIEDLVVLTRLDELKGLALTDVDFSALAEEGAANSRSVVERAGSRFQADIAPGVHVKADKRSLQQLVSILLDNAAKYCDPGGDVAISLAPRGRGARLTVSNTYAEGAGVDFSRFFERFYRQDESHNSKKSGFGIGLSMAKEITERLRGRIRVTSSTQIICFTFELTA